MTRGKHSRDHELKIDSTTRQLTIMRDQNGKAMYSVMPLEEIGDPANILSFLQDDWIGGHGQGDAKERDKYAEGQAIDTTQEGRVISGPLINEIKESDASNLDSAVVAFIYFPAAAKPFLCATAAKIYRYDVGGDNEWTLATTTVAGVTQFVVKDTICYALVGTSNFWYASVDGDTWVQTDLTNGKATYGITAPNLAATADVLWIAAPPNILYNTTNGRRAADGGVALDSGASIGDTSHNITNLMLLNDNLLIGRVDNLYHYDTDGGLHPLLDDLRINRSTNNFKYAVKWQSALYVSLGTRLAELTSRNTYDIMGPLDDLSNNIDKVGTCVGLTADDDHIYVAYDEGTNTIIYKGREVRKDGVLRWEWCPWVFLGAKTMSTMIVVQHSATDRRLWFGYTLTTAYVTITDQPSTDSTARFVAQSFFTTSYFDAGKRDWDKIATKLITETKKLATGGADEINIQPQYRKNAETSFTNLTGTITSNGTVTTQLSSTIPFKRIQFRFGVVSAS